MRFTLRFSKPVPASTQATACKPAFRGRRGIVSFTTVLLFASSAMIVHAQDYTSIVVFGDSLSDTGNVAHLTESDYGVRIPGIATDYADGRFTDGRYTTPAARDYFGVWVEQLAAMLPAKPPVVDSLDGGTDYAYGFATTGQGTGVLTLGPLSVNVDNIGLQITDYLATHPKITKKTLFIVWGGAIDILHATSPDQVFDAGINQSLNIQRLVDAGATQFLVVNVPPLGLTPDLSGMPTQAAAATEATVLYNDVLATGLAIIRDFNIGRQLKIYQLDSFSLLEQLVASPSAYGLTNVTGMSQGNAAVDPDTWLFWDDLHPTTRGHNLLAITADRLLTAPQHWDPFVKDDGGLIHLDRNSTGAAAPAGIR